MKILLVNKFHYLKGGSETYYFELAKLLEKNGHQVAFFSMEDEKNIKTGNKEYFVPHIDLNGKNITKALSIIYNKENKKIMQRALEDFQPDIVHINNFQRQLTCSIIGAIKEKNIPIVYTSHDLQSVCPASAMLCNGNVCEKCLGDSKFNCFKNKCVKNSKLKSLLSSFEGTYYEKKKIYENFDCIVSPSNFVKNKILSSGIKTKIVTIHNFIDLEKFNHYKISDNNYAFYFGRLSIEKGIINLLESFSRQDKGKLFIAGDGPEKDNIKKYITDNKLEKRVKLLGFLTQDEVKKYIASSSFTVVPSIWYENCPYSILESMALSKAIIGSNIGGIPELIKGGKNGFLFEYDDIDKLSTLLFRLFSDKELREELGKNSKKLVEENYSLDKYYNQLIDIYNSLIVGDIYVS